MGWMSIEKETDGVAGGLHAGFGGAPPPPPPPLPAHPVSVPPIARTAIASAPGVRIVAPSWGPQPLAHGAGDGKLGGCPGNHGSYGERCGGCERRARSSLLRRAFRHGSSVVAALAALAPRVVRPAHHDYPDRLLGTERRGERAQCPLSRAAFRAARCASSSDSRRTASRTRVTSPWAHSSSCGVTFASALRS